MIWSLLRPHMIFTLSLSVSYKPNDKISGKELEFELWENVYNVKEFCELSIYETIWCFKQYNTKLLLLIIPQI